MIEFEQDQITGMKILIVDDVLDNLSILGHFLQQSGLEISVARSGEKAFELVEQNKPDLILLDIMMPGIDGLEVCRRLKDDVSTKDIAIIFITAMAGTEDMMRGFNAGGVDYIAKPFHEKEVICRITTHLKLKKAQDEIKRKEKFYRVIVESVCLI